MAMKSFGGIISLENDKKFFLPRRAKSATTFFFHMFDFIPLRYVNLYECALTNAFEMVGEIHGRLTPFEKIVPAGLESRGVLRLAGRYTYAMLRLDFGLLVGLTNRDPSFGISGGATYVITR